MKGVFVIILRGRFGFLGVSVTEWRCEKLKEKGSVSVYEKKNYEEKFATQEE